MLVVLSGLVSSTALANPNPSFDVTFLDCTEFVGLTSIKQNAVDGLIPDAFTIAGDGTNAVLVIRTVDCDTISVDGRRARPGRLSQIGVNLTVEGTAADIDNYTLFYTTDHPLLRARLRSFGLKATRSEIEYELDEDELEAEVEGNKTAEYELESEVQAPQPPIVPFVARWFADGPRGTIDMTTDFPDLRFGVGDTEVEFDDDSALGELTGGESLTFPILDSFNDFSTAHMVVTLP